MTDIAPKFCPQCGKEILGGFDSCVYCGYAPPVAEEHDRLERYWYPAMWVMAFFLFPIGAVVGWRAQVAWQARYPRKAQAMARLNLTAHLVMLVLVIGLTAVLMKYFRAYFDSFTQGNFS